MLIEFVEQNIFECLVNNYCFDVRCIPVCFDVMDWMRYDVVNDMKW